ncbi:zinc ribbon domain-containing protein [Natronorubrum sp. JWXQ-INN-674]|uniref:Zinc ribbon domain-containing protein n=1 Tax=Natronorubrum halalkaliphilum TaxID=2691917 RepID=A0A6B0VS88_9EURY|nr:FmdB family zinc ribbon protein [Natronorubrum halalkaliphilum]MXV64500.1 zinc ribbon domain-containing protein [Natronorubrum halalkaliphilum]
MKTYEFTCPDCRRSFTVTDPMREATLTNGCPVCGGPVAGVDFAAELSEA